MTALLTYIETGAAIGLLWQSTATRLASLLPSRATMIEAGELAAMVGLIALIFAIAVAVGLYAGFATGEW